MKKYLSMLLVVVMLVAVAAGCTSTDQPVDSPTSSPSADVSETPAEPSDAAPVDSAPVDSAPAGDDQPAPTDSAPVDAPPTVPDVPQFNSEKASYPLTTTGEELSFFVEYPGFLAGRLDTLADHTGYLKAEEITGVHIKFQEVSMFALSEQFNLMCNSGSMTDILSGVANYPGGSVAAIEEEIILDLTDLVHTVMGNYWELLNGNPEWIKEATDDNGFMGSVMTLTSATYTTAGPQIRADWLENLNLDVPVTYDDYYDVLMAFKVEYDPTDNLQFLGATQQSGGGWVGGYGTIGASEASASGQMVANMFIDDDGKVQNGYLVDSYKDYLMMMNKWYNDGLMNADFYSKTNDPMAGDADSLILNGNSGIWYAQSNFIGDYMSKATTPGFSILGVTEPVLEENRGDKFHFGTNNQGQAAAGLAISTNCMNPELAAQWLDFWYTKEGQLLTSYGTEGVSYTIVDGKPEFTGLVTANPDLIYQFAVAMYTVGQVSTLTDPAQNFDNYSQESRDAIELWTASTDDRNAMPNVTLTVEETEEYTRIIADINTLANETVTKFVIGTKNFDADWDEFIGQIKAMNIDRAIEIYQNAYERYLAK